MKSRPQDSPATAAPCAPPPWMRAGFDHAALRRAALSAAGRLYQLNDEQLLGRCRLRRIAWGRQVMHWILSRLGPLGSNEAAQILGRERSGICHSIRAVQSARDVYPEIQAETDRALDAAGKILARRAPPQSATP